MAEKSQNTDRAARNFAKTARFGLMTLGVAMLLFAIAWALAQPFGKYFAAFAVLTMCLGMLCLLLAFVEWLQTRR